MTGSFLDAIISILIEFGVPWEPWMANVLPVPVFILMLPFFLRNIRIAQARKALKKSNSYYHDERRELEVKAIAKVKDIPTAMLGLADEAIRMNRYDLAQELIGYVPKTKRYRRELVRIHQKINPSVNRSLPQEVMAIEQMMANGLIEASEKRLHKAKIRWPESQELIALELNLASIIKEEIPE